MTRSRSSPGGSAASETSASGGKRGHGSVDRIPGSLAALLLALSLVAAAAAPAADARAQTPPSSLDRRVLVLGDSVILGARAQVVLRLSASGWQPQVHAAESLHSYNAGPVVDQSRGAVGEVVVIALGHNDEGTPGQFAFWIDQLMARLADVRQVFWVNLRSFRDWVPAANADLVAATRRWPNLRIIDWDARSTPDPSLVVGDGLHLTPLGQGAMADLVGRALDTYAIERGVGETLDPPAPW